MTQVPTAAPLAAGLIETPPPRDLVHVAAELTRDLRAVRARIYWTDLIASVLVGYAALAIACAGSAPAGRLFAGLVGVLALYRAVSFIHELTHLKPGALPGFRFAWNMLVGVPLLVPSFLYEGVHHLHHARSRYGTHEDPEYLRLPRFTLPSVLGFAALSALAPVALLIRFVVLAPASALLPPLRRWVVSRASALAINPAFRRAAPVGQDRRRWLAWEITTSVWALALVGAAATGMVGFQPLLAALSVISGIAILNQARTLTAHLWGSDGEAMSLTDQYLDSVNVPPPAALPALWAPVGLRYHALHHLLPGLPYHALGRAHRRLKENLPSLSQYHNACYRGEAQIVKRLVTTLNSGAGSG